MLKPGPNYDELGGYTTIDQAVTDGAVILAYGYVHPFLSLPACIREGLTDYGAAILLIGRPWLLWTRILANAYIG